MSLDLFKEVKNRKADRTFLIFVVGTFLIGGGVLFLFFRTMQIYLFAFFIGLPIIFLFLRYPKVWLTVLILSLAHYFRDIAKGLSAIDIIFAFFLLGSLLAWFVIEIFIKKKKLILHMGEYLLIFFFLAALFNIFIAYANGAKPLDWFREYAIIAFMLYYFPFREHMKNKKDIMHILFAFSLVTLVIDFFQFYDYYIATLSDIQYVFELEKSARKNQSLFTAGCTIGFALFIYERNNWKKLYLLFFTSTTFAALILTFSRTFWIIFLFNVVLMFIYFSPKYKLRILAYSSVILVIITSIILISFQDKAELFIKVIENRIASSTKGKKDPSIQARLYEYEQVLNNIEKNPLGGNGLAKSFDFFNPITLKTNHSFFIHNGYLFIAYRVGIPLAIVFLLIILLFTVKAESAARQARSEFQKVIGVASLGIIALIILSNFMTTPYVQRDGPFIMAVVFALVSNNHLLYRSRKNNV